MASESHSKNMLYISLLILPIVIIAALTAGFVIVQHQSMVTTITTILTSTVTNTAVITTTLSNGSTRTTTVYTSTVVTVTSTSTSTIRIDDCPSLGTNGSNATASVTNNMTSATRSALGLIVPLYSAPGCAWSQLIDAKKQYPSIPIIAIINPHNGSGVNKDPTYSDWIQRMQEANISVIGYVNTAYGRATQSEIKANITNYVGWFHLNGIFFDEMGNTPGKQGYYSSLSQYAHSLGALYTVGDPGTSTLPSYVGTVDNLMIFENRYLPNASLIEQNSMGQPRSGFSFVAYEVPQLPPQSYFNDVALHVAWVWISNTNHSFQDLPSYLPQEMQEILAVPTP